MDRLRVRLLGSFDVRLGERSLVPLESARVESLLAYLLLHRDAPQSRQRLAFVLWPDSVEAQARTNLRKVLHNLRRELPQADRFIDVGPRTLRWRADAPLWLDVEEFERAVADGRLEDAAEAYGGELLEGSYDDWVVEDRERLAQLHLDVLERLTRRCEEREAWSAAARFAERLVAQDPLREESHRLLIRVCRAAGDRPRALRAYHVCAGTLERELGIEPSETTRVLYESLIADDPADQRSAAAAVPISATQSAHTGMAGVAPPFVGRSVERAALAAAWDSAAAGRAGLVLVSGEAGIGKTRLVDELRAGVSGVSVQARAYPGDGSIAYGLAVSWLRSQRVAARLGRLDRSQRMELARILPELGSHVPPPEPLGAELRRRLLAAIGQALLAAGSPLLLILDDLQWADTPSLQVIHYLLRAAPTARLLVAATARREDLGERGPVAALIAALEALERFDEIALERLDSAETAVLAERIAGAPLDRPALERLFADSEGNPLFIVEALQPDAPAGIPAKVQAMIAGRLSRLTMPAAELAEIAAAIGRSFTADVLAAAAGLDERAFVAALDELWRRGIMRAHGPNAYDFSHGKIRDAAYAALSPPQRRRAHLAIAHALERSGTVPPAALALHYENAGSTAAAVRWYERAAEVAQWLHAHGDAVDALDRALTLSEELPPGPETAALQLRMLTALPAALGPLEGYGSERIARVHARGMRLVEQLGDEPEPPLIWSLALAALVRGDWDAGREFGERLRARAQRDGDHVLLVESGYITGISSYWPGNLAQARAHFDAAMKRFEPTRRQQHVARYGQDPELVVRLRLAHTLWLLGEDDEADRERDLALAAARHSSHHYSRAVVAVWAAMLAMDRGDIAQLRFHADALARYATDDAPAQIVLPAEAFAGHLDVVDDRAAGGLARVRAVRERVLRGQPPAPGLPGVATRILLEDYAIAGQAEDGLALADDALEMGRGAELWEAEIRRLRAVFLGFLGATTAEVEDELRRAQAGAPAPGAHGRGRCACEERSRNGR